MEQIETHTRIRRTGFISDSAPYYRIMDLLVLPSYREHPTDLPHETVIELADKALYLAKESGRNCGVGVEVIPEAYNPDNPAGWLDKPLPELDGKYIKLTRIDGPGPTPDPNPLPSTEDR